MSKLLKCEVTGVIYKRGVWGMHKHHFIKKQQYDKNPEWYKSRGLKQRLIPLFCDVHMALHSGMSDTAFYKRYGIERHKLLFNKEKYYKGYYDKENKNEGDRENTGRI